MLPRSITIGAFFFFVQSSALVALPMLEQTASSSLYANALTIAADASNDILILIGAAPFCATAAACRSFSFVFTNPLT
jgi:hypothetical protein